MSKLNKIDYVPPEAEPLIKAVAHLACIDGDYGGAIGCSPGWCPTNAAPNCTGGSAATGCCDGGSGAG